MASSGVGMQPTGAQSGVAEQRLQVENALKGSATLCSSVSILAVEFLVAVILSHKNS